MTKYKPCDLPSVKLQDKKKKRKRMQSDLFFNKRHSFSCVFKSDEIGRNTKLQPKFTELSYTVHASSDSSSWMDGCNTNILQLLSLFSPSQALGCMLTLVLAQAQMAVERRSVWINAIMWPSIRRGLHVEKQVITLLVMKLLIWYLN